MTARFGHGLIIGKFYPPHCGHDHLIRTAVRDCRRVTVEVIASSVETIPVEERAAWLRQTHPTVDVIATVDDTPVDYGSTAAWDAHTAIITGLLRDFGTCRDDVDAVFTSDDYGAELARRLDATWVQVDPGRIDNPVSGTQVREDLFRWWPMLSPSVRGDMVRRAVVVGAESTGTTTLAQALAQHYGTSWVPEYGREYSVTRAGGLGTPWRSDEFDLIVDRQQRNERAAARTSPTPLLICDTDVLATSVWHERYVGSASPTVVAAAASHRPLCYVLTGDEIPFVDDGLRDGEHIRHGMARRFREVLAAQPVPWIEVSGEPEARLAQAVAFIDEQSGAAFTFAQPLDQVGQPSSSATRRR
ncbi:AAA family ATPase [Gordonia sp. X0973]|uniref:AAA family ATPase n=1 Tax=Gordonia sp. X0973 TaxID=2742602 RepID=UPI000F53C760|nr:AAA family ATPase [Gordonia sp. X0973]QKT05888.1 AAA family ATPase [Gordonia sp. X0973]